MPSPLPPVVTRQAGPARCQPRSLPRDKPTSAEPGRHADQGPSNPIRCDKPIRTCPSRHASATRPSPMRRAMPARSHATSRSLPGRSQPSTTCHPGTSPIHHDVPSYATPERLASLCPVYPRLRDRPTHRSPLRRSEPYSSLPTRAQPPERDYRTHDWLHSRPLVATSRRKPCRSAPHGDMPSRPITRRHALSTDSFPSTLRRTAPQSSPRDLSILPPPAVTVLRSNLPSRQTSTGQCRRSHGDDPFPVIPGRCDEPSRRIHSTSHRDESTTAQCRLDACTARRTQPATSRNGATCPPSPFLASPR